MLRPTVLLALGIVVGCAHGPAEVDPLDRVTGTEGWTPAVESRSEEWRDWFRARQDWRKAVREARLQRYRSQRVAGLLFRGQGAPDLDVIRQVVTAPSGDPSSSKRRQGGQQHDQRSPSWFKVPVERLDEDGQAIDEEGDRVLERVPEYKGP